MLVQLFMEEENNAAVRQHQLILVSKTVLIIIDWSKGRSLETWLVDFT
jgi:hypothetical protein